MSKRMSRQSPNSNKAAAAARRWEETSPSSTSEEFQSPEKEVGDEHLTARQLKKMRYKARREALAKGAVTPPQSPEIQEAIPLESTVDTPPQTEKQDDQDKEVSPMRSAQESEKTEATAATLLVQDDKEELEHLPGDVDDCVVQIEPQSHSDNRVEAETTSQPEETARQDASSGREQDDKRKPNEVDAEPEEKSASDVQTKQKSDSDDSFSGYSPPLLSNSDSDDGGTLKFNASRVQEAVEEDRRLRPPIVPPTRPLVRDQIQALINDQQVANPAEQVRNEDEYGPREIFLITMGSDADVTDVEQAIDNDQQVANPVEQVRNEDEHGLHFLANSPRRSLDSVRLNVDDPVVYECRHCIGRCRRSLQESERGNVEQAVNNDRQIANCAEQGREHALQAISNDQQVSNPVEPVRNEDEHLPIVPHIIDADRPLENPSEPERRNVEQAVNNDQQVANRAEQQVVIGNPNRPITFFRLVEMPEEEVRLHLAELPFYNAPPERIVFVRNLPWNRFPAPVQNPDDGAPHRRWLRTLLAAAALTVSAGGVYIFTKMILYDAHNDVFL